MTIPTRTYTSYEPKWGHFYLQNNSNKNNSTSKNNTSSHQNHPYARQYNHVYSRRLDSLRERCLENANVTLKSAHDTSTSVIQVPRIIELKEDVLCTIVGTIVKDTPGRPVVDTDYQSSSLYKYNTSKDDDPMTLQPLRTYASDEKDVLVLEDESGRVELLSHSDKDTLQAYKMVTGMVVAVTGIVQGNTGVMEVSHVHYPMLAPQKTSLPKPISVSSPCIMLLSGLHCGSPGSANDLESSLSLKRGMLADYIAGHITPNDDAAHISRLIIAGGGCDRPQNFPNEEDDENNASAPSFSSKKKNTPNPFIQSMNYAIQELDLFISEICSSGIPTDLIPGLHDPTNANFPQQPLHSCVLPHSSSFGEELFQRTTNPYAADIGNALIMGSDGRNVINVRRFTYDSAKITNADKNEKAEIPMISCLDALEQTLRCSHIAPTAPDSLHCYPFYDEDPFVIEECPNIYFAGNCPAFESKLIEGKSGSGDQKTTCRLICVPSFAETGEVVLVNLDTLDCECISFTDISDTSDKDMEE